MLAALPCIALSEEKAKDEKPAGKDAPEAKPALDADTADALIKDLASEKPDAPAKAVDQLARAGEQAIPYLLKQKKNKNETIRRKIAAILGRIMTKDSLDALYEMLADKSEAVRREAICSVGNHQKPESLEKLQDFLLHKSSAIRLETVMALGRIGHASSLPALKRSCLDDDQMVRQGAVVALGLVKDKGAIPDVISRLRDDDKTVRTLAYVVLKRLSGTDLGFDPADDEPKRNESILLWETWWKANEKSGTGGSTGQEQKKKE